MEIVIFGGTVEGRLLAEALLNRKIKLHICVATEYGASLLPKSENIIVHQGRMEEEEMEAFLVRTAPSYCLDATHPYAALVTANIRNACKKLEIPYIRIYRQEESCSDFTSAGSVEEAAEFLKGVKGNILITTGSKELEKYTVIPDYETRCFVRVLPTVPVLEKCQELGFSGRNLIAMQGPFDEDMNYALLKQTKCTWLVTKNSGKEGGYQEKCEAALLAGANILVVERPAEEKQEEETAAAICEGAEENAGQRTALKSILSLPEAVSFLQSLDGEGKARRRGLSLIGVGPGNPRLLTKEAIEAVRKSDVLIGAGRMLDTGMAVLSEDRKTPVFKSYVREEIADFLKAHQEYKQAGILYSGDVGFFSGARGMRELLADFETEEISGISSPVYFLNRLGIPWEDTLLLSCHGKQLNLIPLIREHKKICVLLGKRTQISEISRKLAEFHMENIKITVGERLSYPGERIVSGSPGEMAEQEFDSLSVALFENPEPEKTAVTAGIRDEEFIRGSAPMTKEEIRALSLSKLKLTEDAVVYDIGAGTGSVSVEAALLCKKGQVYAIEQKAEAAALIRENKIRFQVENLEVIQGTAPDCLRELPSPTHVFIGGSGGRLQAIIAAVREKNPKAGFVINAVTLETIAALERIREQFPEYGNMEVIQVNVAKSRLLGGYHLMNGENPVMIISFKEDN